MSAFSALVEALHAHLTADPNDRIRLGISEGLGDLPDPSLAAIEDRLARATALRARLDAVDGAALDFDDQLDLDLARLILDQEILRGGLRFNGRSTAQQKPEAGDALGDGIFLISLTDPRPAAARLDDITARLEQVPRYLAAMLGRLERPVARWVEIELDKIAGLPQLFGTVEDWAVHEGYPALARLRAARARAEAALQTYEAGLRALPTTANLHIGEAAAAALIASKGLAFSLEELHEIAADFLAGNAADLESLREILVARHGLPQATTIVELHRILNARYAVRIRPGALDDVLTRYEEVRAQLLAFIAARDLFPIPEAQDIRILRTPAFMAPSIPAGAMMPPPAFRDGVRTSLVYLTLSEALLDEHTALGIPVMMLHEGIPGHHLQLTHAAAHASTVRRHVDALDQAEGWTTMLEDYMLDQGLLGDLTDEARFIARRDIARIGARVAIDLFFMTGDRRYLDVGVDADLSSPDPFVAAGNLLEAVTGFTPGRVQAELNWYSQERGYPLSYLAGNKAVWALKREVQAHNAGRLEGLDLDRAFHKVFLEAGAMPVSYMRRVYTREGLLP